MKNKIIDFIVDKFGDGQYFSREKYLKVYKEGYDNAIEECKWNYNSGIKDAIKAIKMTEITKKQSERIEYYTDKNGKKVIVDINAIKRLFIV